MKITIILENEDQNFIEWDLNDKSEVVASRPPSELWLGAYVDPETLTLGQQPMVCTKTLRSGRLKYKIVGMAITGGAQGVPPA